MKISNSLATLIIGIALLLVAGIGYHQYQQTIHPPEGRSPEDNRPFHTEEEWTVRQISQFLADLGAFSKKDSGKLSELQISKAKSSETPDTYTLKWDGRKKTISVENGVWNPEIYTAWAKEVFAPSDSATPETSSLDVAQTLLSPSFDTFHSEDQRLSAFLNEHPASASGQLQAALLMGTVALNDYSGEFLDLRIPLNRMIAHLAAADALGIPTSDPSRQLAEAIRLTLCGQQDDALEVIATLEADKTLAEWGAILLLRNTLDWREGRETALNGSPALRYEYFRALTRAINGAAGIAFLKDLDAKPDATFWRIANEIDLSVQGGHMFSKPILEFEFMESAGAAKKFGMTVEKENSAWMADYLDTPEGSMVIEDESGQTIQVAGRNFFAGYHQRHLMQGGQKAYGFLKDNWGVHDQAEQMQNFLTSQLPDLRYKPFLLRMIARNDASRKEANLVCEAIIRDQNEIVTPALWASLRRNEDGTEILPAPDFHAWFHPEVPRGTAFANDSRLFEIGVGDENDDEWMRVLWERAPYSRALAMHNAFLENNNSWDDISSSIIVKWLGPQTEITKRGMTTLANAYKGQPALYEESMKNAAALDPNLYITMGSYFKNQGMDEKAASYYLQAFEKATDRIWMANSSPWLVKHLFQNNARDQASKVAVEAAEVYSHSGLSAQLWLMEAEGQWDKALETAKKIDVRYNRRQPVVESACLIRLNEIAPKAAEAAGFRGKIARIFPDGVQKAPLMAFSAPPKSGVLINGTARSLVPFGLEKGMVIVALNGYLTDTFDQYLIIRDLSDDPKLSMVVWDGSSYSPREGDLPGHRFGVDMIDYHGQ